MPSAPGGWPLSAPPTARPEGSPGPSPSRRTLPILPARTGAPRTSREIGQTLRPVPADLDRGGGRRPSR
ncbi:MAG: hypothetical protein ACK56I_31560 [bacterium]